MKKNSIVYILLTILISLTVHYQADAKNIIVCPNCTIKNLQEALDVATDGDHILIKPGHYISKTIHIKKPVTIQGEGFPVLEAVNHDEVLVVEAGNVTIEGLQVQHVATNYTKDKAGIRVSNSRNCTVRNNRLYDTFFGIYFQNSKHGNVYGNIVIGNAKQEMSSGNAIHVWYCDSMKISNNRALHHRDGIYFEFVTNSDIENNHSEGNIRYGLHFMFSHFDNYIGNTFKNNGTGVAVMFSDSIVMINNKFLNNWGNSSYGLLLKDIRYSTLRDNHFFKNTIGIHADNSNYNIIENNIFEQNGWAIRILGNCMNDTITHNSFISNNFDISTTSKMNHNWYQSNYWGNYTGYDLDKNGVGDTPYYPVTLSSYLVSNYPASIILLRSTFIDVLNLVEKIAPVFTPTELKDPSPLMKNAL